MYVQSLYRKVQTFCTKRVLKSRKKVVFMSNINETHSSVYKGISYKYSELLWITLFLYTAFTMKLNFSKVFNVNNGQGYCSKIDLKYYFFFYEFFFSSNKVYTFFKGLIRIVTRSLFEDAPYLYRFNKS